ncbi:MAG: hypothetical protein ABL962_13910 [Fimbriimonadaceae bacterium]
MSVALTPGRTYDAEIQWEGRALRLSYTPRRWNMVDHVEIHASDGRLLPITKTGYRSQFFGPVEPTLDLQAVIENVRDQLDLAARKSEWCEAEEERQQLTLFE